MMPQIQNCHLKVKLCSFLEAIKPWAHLVAQVMGMRWGGASGGYKEPSPEFLFYK